jgi:hypothetical protein
VPSHTLFEQQSSTLRSGCRYSDAQQLLLAILTFGGCSKQWSNLVPKDSYSLPPKPSPPQPKVTTPSCILVFVALYYVHLVNPMSSKKGRNWLMKANGNPSNIRSMKTHFIAHYHCVGWPVCVQLHLHPDPICVHHICAQVTSFGVVQQNLYALLCTPVPHEYASRT